jgi:hypothetical protein
VILKLTRICDSVLESSARLVTRDEEKYALVSRKKSVDMVRMARVERMEPRRVPSRRSRGTLRYMSREARRMGAMVLLLLDENGGGVMNDELIGNPQSPAMKYYGQRELHNRD